MTCSCQSSAEMGRPDSRGRVLAPEALVATVFGDEVEGVGGDIQLPQEAVDHGVVVVGGAAAADHECFDEGVKVGGFH